MSKAQPPFEIWGLTGGVASGKSALAKIFSDAGVPVIDADEIARALRAPDGAAHDAIAKRFGTDEPAALRRIVFDDPAARRDLEAILHPMIRAESLRRMGEIATARAPAPKPLRILYEAALLVESRRLANFSGLLVVEASPELRKKRLLARDGISAELAEKMLRSQVSDEERRALATFVFENNGTIEDLKKLAMKFIAANSW